MVAMRISAKLFSMSSLVSMTKLS